MPRKNVRLPNGRVSTPLSKSKTPVFMKTTKLGVTNRRPFSSAVNVSYAMPLSLSPDSYKFVGIACSGEVDECFEYYYHTDQHVEEQRQLREHQLRQTPSLTSLRNSSSSSSSSSSTHRNLCSNSVNNPESVCIQRPPSRVRMIISRFEGSSSNSTSLSSNRSYDNNRSISIPTRSSSRPRPAANAGTVVSTQSDGTSDPSIASAASATVVSVHISLVSQFLAHAKSISVSTQSSTPELPPDTYPVMSEKDCPQKSSVADSALHRTPSIVGDFMAKRKAVSTADSNSLAEVVAPQVGVELLETVFNKLITAHTPSAVINTSRVDKARMTAFLERAKRLTTVSATANASVSAALSTTALTDPVPSVAPVHNTPPITVSVPALAAKYLERASSRPRPQSKDVDRDPHVTRSVSEAVAAYARPQSHPNGGGICGNGIPVHRPLSPFNHNQSQTSSVMALRAAWERASSRPRAGTGTIAVTVSQNNIGVVSLLKPKDRNSDPASSAIVSTRNHVERESTDHPTESSTDSDYFNSCKENRLVGNSRKPT